MGYVDRSKARLGETWLCKDQPECSEYQSNGGECIGWGEITVIKSDGSVVVVRVEDGDDGVGWIAGLSLWVKRL